MQRVTAPQMRRVGLPALDVAGVRAARRGPHVARRRRQRGQGQCRSRHGLGALERGWRARRQGRWRSRRRARQRHALCLRPSCGRRARDRHAGARHARHAASAGDDPPERRRTSRRSDGLQADGRTGASVANGGAIRIDHLAGKTPNGGSISATGDVRLDPAAGFPGSIRLTGQHAQLVANPHRSPRPPTWRSTSPARLRRSRESTGASRSSRWTSPCPTASPASRADARHEASEPDRDRARAARAEGQGQGGAARARRCSGDARADGLGGEPHLRARPRHQRRIRRRSASQRRRAATRK